MAVNKPIDKKGTYSKIQRKQSTLYGTFVNAYFWLFIFTVRSLNNNIRNSRTYLTGNTLHLCFEAESSKAVERKIRFSS
jgi:hypothetical protein